MFEKIKQWYQEGKWTIVMVRNAVAKGIITKTQYKKITGETYPDPNQG